MSSHAGLRYVEPRVRRGPLYRGIAWLSATRGGRWLSRKLFWKMDPFLLAVTKGRLCSGLVIPVGVLETRGARTGGLRRRAVIYFHDDDRVTIVASNAGAPENPSWYYNALADPEVTFGGHPFRAEVVGDEAERARLWTLADRVFPPYAVFRERGARAGRSIPILQLLAR